MNKFSLSRRTIHPIADKFFMLKPPSAMHQLLLNVQFDALNELQFDHTITLYVPSVKHTKELDIFYNAY
jgi:hypothetical protein